MRRSFGPLAGRLVTFTLGSQSCTATTNGAGFASCSIASITQDPGPSTLVVNYAGDAVTQPASKPVGFSITTAPTTLTAPVPAPGLTSMTLSASLTETASGSPLKGEPITLSLGGSSSCTTTTTAAGIATCSVATPPGATATLTATFAGDTDYAGSGDTKPVVLLKPTTVTYIGATTGDYHDSAMLSARVVDGFGQYVVGKSVDFSLGGQTCSDSTNSSGVASCTITSIERPAGPASVSVSFAAQGLYLASSTSATFTVSPEQTTLLAGVTGPVLNDASITLTSTLREDGVYAIAGRTVTMTLGPRTCTALTSPAGVATCPVSALTTLGPTAMTATFATDGFYQPASVTSPVTLYALAPGGGTFVVGDGSATGSVMFWGAQWWKLNTLSGGGSPPAFKGFAASSAQCRVRWTTGPGNSPKPPDGPLPTYMAVAVSDSITQSGSSISGTTVHIVVVRTDAGYKSDPGHAGTGTVVATVC